MANIMMTDQCNLSCPYCFANEFVNHDKNEISEEAFDKAVDFIVRDGVHSAIGLIGGEPTVHSQFDYLLRKLLVDTRVQRITLYTNGLLLDRHWNTVLHPKVHMLINLNPPSLVGVERFERILNNLDHIFADCARGQSTTLGINMFGQDFEYQYMLEALKRYSCRFVRVSIVVPNLEKNRNTNAHEYFRKMKPRVLEFFKDLLDEGIVPNFDCNKMPGCLLTTEELSNFAEYLNNEDLFDRINKSNIYDRVVMCRPVIDIRQDLTAVRCFGLSSCTKESINQFRDICELEQYYLRTVDAFAYNTTYSEACIDCHERKVMKCSGGCYAFKEKEIIALQDFVERRLRNRVTRDE